MKKLFQASRLVAVATLSFAALSAQAQQTVRMAVTDIVGLENLQREFGGFQKILSEKSGMKVELFPVPNRTAAVEALNAKKIDLVLTGPAEYVVFKKRSDAKLVVGFSRPEYYGSVVTLVGSGVDGVEDLKGKKVALGDVGSTSRHLSPIQVLADLGVQPQKDFQVLHVNRNVAVEAMKRGDVAAIGINRTDLPGLSKKFPDVVFKVIARGRDLPNDVLLAGAHVPDATVAAMKKVFSENSPALIDAVLMGPDENQKFRGMAFIPTVADSDYNYVRKMYATIGQPQYAEFLGD
ncbi:phosphonate transport system substrate-binding protein [Hydrogenophaga palleronii]|uniref:Phosphonate transport system substrate-binding protein n=1 Tax=Hydrogenophaga palleronii TaxID=65655 RepID=A0ABU1WR02_9BURK|nr:PhnD/SsuA/transferrin family substrate-binding protein [Hydrogenophaga palleronii]MDR7151619.1 phosphonate transport system substrate-binding protein [Hydrogenophaga palleronii]